MLKSSIILLLKQKWSIHVMLNVVVKKFEYFKENLLLPGLEVNEFNNIYIYIYIFFFFFFFFFLFFLYIIFFSLNKYIINIYIYKHVYIYIYI